MVLQLLCDELVSTVYEKGFIIKDTYAIVSENGDYEWLV